MESSHNSTMEPLDLAVYLRRFLKSLKMLWPLLILLSVLLAGQNYLQAKKNYRPVYECNALISVGSGYTSGDIFSSTSYYDTAAAQAMASSFSHILSSEFMRDLMTAELGGPISGSVSASVINSTSLVELRATGSDPEKLCDTLNAVITCYPQAAVYMMDNPILTVREAPVVPTDPINVFSPSATVKAGAARGFLIGMGIVVFFALLNQTITSPKELKNLISLPVIATIPQIHAKKRRKTQTLITAADDAALAEALRSLRTKVRRHVQEKEGRVILLTSTIPGEGKTTVSSNLALSLAAEGYRVVLIDADMRNQTVGRIFRNTKDTPGLMECLKNPKLSVLSCLKEVPGENPLYYLSGSSTEKRHYSIEPNAYLRILDTLLQHFDYVVVDTPPCTVVSDTSLLARFADCVLYVVKLNYANRFQILDGISGLHQRNVPLTGCIINGASREQHNYGYGKKYGYSQARKNRE